MQRNMNAFATLLAALVVSLAVSTDAVGAQAFMFLCTSDLGNSDWGR